MSKCFNIKHCHLRRERPKEENAEKQIRWDDIMSTARGPRGDVIPVYPEIRHARVASCRAC